VLEHPHTLSNGLKTLPNIGSSLLADTTPVYTLKHLGTLDDNVGSLDIDNLKYLLGKKKVENKRKECATTLNTYMDEEITTLAAKDPWNLTGTAERKEYQRLLLGDHLNKQSCNR
jgi:hypothetical protein